MKGLRRFASKKWNGLPIGAITIALVLSLVIGGGVYAAVVLLSGTANVTVQEAITLTQSAPTDGTWSNNTWNVSMYPGETKTCTLKLSNAGSVGIPVTVSMEAVTDLTNSVKVWSGTDWITYNGVSYAVPGGGDGYVQFQVTANTSSSIGGKTLSLSISR